MSPQFHRKEPGPELGITGTRGSKAPVNLDDVTF